MKAVLFGATRGMGRALARLMAERGDRLFLLGRDSGELLRSAADLEVRGASGKVGSAHCDLLEPASFPAALDRADAELQGIDTIVVSAGMFETQEALESDRERCAQLLQADFVGTVGFCEEARSRLLATGGGTLCVFSSVAGDRARKPVILYGAAKAGLSHYLQGLDHKFRGEGLAVVTVKPGFVHTGMTAGLEPPPFAGRPEPVALTVLAGIDRGRPVVYVPPIWRWIMQVIRLLPRQVMRRLSF